MYVCVKHRLQEIPEQPWGLLSGSHFQKKKGAKPYRMDPTVGRILSLPAIHRFESQNVSFMIILSDLLHKIKQEFHPEFLHQDDNWWLTYSISSRKRHKIFIYRWQKLKHPRWIVPMASYCSLRTYTLFLVSMCLLSTFSHCEKR